jgi:hypothetical protein
LLEEVANKGFNEFAHIIGVFALPQRFQDKRHSPCRKAALQNLESGLCIYKPVDNRFEEKRIADRYIERIKTRIDFQSEQMARYVAAQWEITAISDKKNSIFEVFA